jgi:hypothetical protein
LDMEMAALLATAAESNNKQQQHVLHDPYRVWLHVPSRPFSSIDASFRILGNEESNRIVVENNNNSNIHHHHHHDNNDKIKNNNADKNKKRKKAQEEEEEKQVEEDYDTDIPATMGGKLAQLSVDGLLNAMAGMLGGVVVGATTTASAQAPFQDTQQQQQQQQKAALSLFWRNMAVTWHRSLQFTIRQDILRTTPLRIQAMLAADLSNAEFASIRKRYVTFFVCLNFLFDLLMDVVVVFTSGKSYIHGQTRVALHLRVARSDCMPWLMFHFMPISLLSS